MMPYFAQISGRSKTEISMFIHRGHSGIKHIRFRQDTGPYLRHLAVMSRHIIAPPFPDHIPVESTDKMRNMVNILLHTGFHVLLLPERKEYTVADMFQFQFRCICSQCLENPCRFRHLPCADTDIALFELPGHGFSRHLFFFVYALPLIHHVRLLFSPFSMTRDRIPFPLPL